MTEVAAAVLTPARAPARLAAGWPARASVARTAGPALLVAAGYVDPGNWGTDVAAGAQFGYRLVWVLAAATAAALFLQHLSARLGFASGHDLASLLRGRLPRPVRRLVFPPLLGALAVTEVVEVLGVVIGVRMLTGLPLAGSVALAAAMVLAVLVAPAGTGRRAVYACLALVGTVYLTVLARHGLGATTAGLRPGPLPPGGLPVAVGLVGAVVMPHNVLLHSALARDLRRGGMDRDQLARLQRGSLISTAGALAVALAVNCAIMSVAAGSAAGPAGGLATALHSAGPTFGAATSALFAVTLIAAGLASAVTGGMVGADVIRRLLPALPGSDTSRRICCLVPAVAVAASGLPEVAVLVWSQVVLTIALPLVLVPLVWFTGRRDLMGDQAPGRPVRAAAAALTGLLIAAGAASLVSS
ncbi:MAG: manganese transport protein [Mycobacteriales bacterium]